ncbi:hypothetical protein LXA43DRAFT_1096462 [Ganoderma leucocontextum]|nr:hypothetical protein LXA43DRAFT_1096462 [Ganoderma leucocontextum]
MAAPAPGFCGSTRNVIRSRVQPYAGRKRTNPMVTNQSTLAVTGTMNDSHLLTDTQQPVSKKRKGAVDIQTTGGTTKAKQDAVRVQSDAVPVNSTGSVASAPPRPQAGATWNVKATVPRVVLSVDSDSAVESEDDVPLVPWATANSTKASIKAGKHQPESQKPLTRGTMHANAHAKAPVESTNDEAEDVVESNASHSADKYAPEEDDEAYSDEDELDNPLSEDLEELEVQLRDEAPVWMKEKDAQLPLVLRRKHPKKCADLLIQLEEEEQLAASKYKGSTSKASQRQQLEQPVWKAVEPVPNKDADDDFEPWGPVSYSIPSLEDGPWEENIGGGAADESDTLSDDGANFHPQAYEIKPPTTPGVVLSLKEQHEHIQDMIHYTFIHVESNLIFLNSFPDAVSHARFVYDAMRDSAQELSLRGLYHRLGQDTSFARALASLVHRPSTFRAG